MQQVEGLSSDYTMVASVIGWSFLHMFSFPAGDEISDNDIA